MPRLQQLDLPLEPSARPNTEAAPETRISTSALSRIHSESNRPEAGFSVSATANFKPQLGLTWAIEKPCAREPISPGRVRLGQPSS
jgi:hypothetical protein